MPDSDDHVSIFAASITVGSLGFTADKAVNGYSGQDRLAASLDIMPCRAVNTSTRVEAVDHGTLVKGPVTY
jgi:hypothetical protein